MRNEAIWDLPKFEPIFLKKNLWNQLWENLVLGYIIFTLQYNKWFLNFNIKMQTPVLIPESPSVTAQEAEYA